MQKATIVIPNLNGLTYLEKCLDSLREQTMQDFSIILIDNGSTDGSAEFVAGRYPEVRLIRHNTNTGFCYAVNEGIRLSDTPYVILLNNDTICESEFVEKLVRRMEKHPDCFSCASRMVRMDSPDLIDSAGDYYCALGWAFARGKGKPAAGYEKAGPVFSTCAGAAIYRRKLFESVGYFDEAHFAYLEDVDVCYRARIAGYRILYEPEAVVRHVGSAASGSIYNDFKIRHSSRNNVYLIYKNMPLLQILLNLPLLAAGFAVKLAFFASRGFGKEYFFGLGKGIRLSRKNKNRKVRYKPENLGNYVRIQLELWVNIFRRLAEF